MDRVLIVTVVVLGLPGLSYGESVMKYGAVGDGIADDTSAFQKAWENACNGGSKMGSIYVPAGKVFLLNSLHITGPCTPKSLLFTIDGEVTAQSDPNKWEKGQDGIIPWLIFDQVDRLEISGRGSLDGQGKAWWDIHCRDHPGPDRVLIITVVVLGLPGLSYGESVMKYGAVGDGIADDTSAFQKAWENACNGGSKMGSIYVPAGKVFLLNSLHITGPCTPKSLLFTIDGEVTAQSDPNKWEKGQDGIIPWLIFDQVDRLEISGRGSLDGQGKAWWDIHCRDHPGPNCRNLEPTMMTLSNCRNVTLKSLRMRNSAQTHILVIGSQNVNISDIKITSPEASPNTDGIHISSSTAVSISHLEIATGDDCVSIGDKVSNVNVSFVNCGPGHGVSIGSLGKDETKPVAVENIRVWNVNFTGTTNGARIKTRPGGTGYVRGIEFVDIGFSSVQNPIIIDQFYGCSPNCEPTKKAVHIENVRYMKMKGTSTTKVAVKFNCSGESVPSCSNILMKDIDLSPADGIDSVSSLCSFVHGSSNGFVRPSSCLS